MIQITIGESTGESKKLRQMVRVEGHSSLGKKGENILCAGVSTLAQAVVLAMETILCLEVQAKRSEGFLEFHIPADLQAEQKQGAQLLLNMFVLSVKNFEEQFPSEIQITIPNHFDPSSSITISL